MKGVKEEKNVNPEKVKKVYSFPEVSFISRRKSFPFRLNSLLKFPAKSE